MILQGKNNRLKYLNKIRCSKGMFEVFYQSIRKPVDKAEALLSNQNIPKPRLMPCEQPKHP